MNIIRNTAWIGVVLSALLLGACTDAKPDVVATESPKQTSTPSPSDTPMPTPTPEPVVREAKLVAVGDIMVHSPQLPAYYDRTSNRYSFDPWFEQVKPVLQAGDWVFGNLETPLAGQDLKYSGYPRFNAPSELAEALVNAGFQIVSTANNHTMDRGFPGVERTLHNVRSAGLVPVGTAVDALDATRITIEERNGIHMGFLAYTYGTNGIPVPKDKPFAVNLIDAEVIRSDIASLKNAGADVIAVSLHFGQEYQRKPNEHQTKLARELIGAGADIILGSHPHVIQPYERVSVPASESVDGIAHEGIVVYSMGNFISNQTGDWKDVGLIFGVNVKKTEQPDGSVSIELGDIEATPTWVHIKTVNKLRHYTIVPMERALSSRDVPGLTAQDYKTMEQLLASMNKHLQQS